MPDPLRMCHICTMTNWGGVERLMVDSLTRVSQTRVHHSLLTTSSIAETVAPIRKAGVPVFEPSRRWRYDPNVIRQMARWLQEHEIQLIHTYDAHANSWGYLAGKLARTPIRVAGERGTVWGWPPPIRWLDRLAQQSADLIVTNSLASSTMLRHYYGIRPQRIRVIRNAVPPLPEVDRAAIRAKLRIAPEHYLVGSIGRLVNVKGYSTFIRAAAIVAQKRSDTRFILIGNGPLWSELRAQRHALGLSEALVMTGWREDARTLLQAFDLFVSTSIHESFGNALIESSLAAIPVIAPCIDGIPEAVVDGVTGILLKPTEPVYQSPHDMPPPKHILADGTVSAPKSVSPGLLAETIMCLLDDSGKRMMLGRNGAKRAQTLFSVDRYIKDVEQTYLQLSCSTAH